MDRPRPIPQEIYRHFKGNLYQIVTIAIHSETREELVVYQALYGDYKTYCRPLSMFMSEVDRVKYPEVTQKYRFEKVEKALLEQPKTEKMPESGAEVKAEEKKVNHSTTETIREQFRNEPYKHSEVMDKTVDAEAEELNLDPLVIEFMDADLAADKNDILSKLRPVITNDMIDL